MKCVECKSSFTPSNRGSPQKYCSEKCRMRAYRKRVAKLRHSQLSKKSANVSAGSKHCESEAKRLKQEVLSLSSRIRALQKPHHSMAIVIEKVQEKGKPVRYIARDTIRNDWNNGPSVKEALGGLIYDWAITRQVTVESIDFAGFKA